MSARQSPFRERQIGVFIAVSVSIAGWVLIAGMIGALL
jgi:hypothetical protein